MIYTTGKRPKENKKRDIQKDDNYNADERIKSKNNLEKKEAPAEDFIIESIFYHKIHKSRRNR